jgi:hypothetical protein
MAKKSSDFPSPAAILEPTDGNPSPEQDLDPGEAGGEAAALDKLQIISAALASQRDEWITARAAQGHDARWAEDVDQFNGKDAANKLGAAMMDSVQQGYPITKHGAATTRSTVFVQVTRQKTNAMAARVCDVALPTDEPNFSVGPSPLPRLPNFVQAPPSPFDANQGAAAPAQPGAQPTGAPGGADMAGAGAMSAGPGAPAGPQAAAQPPAQLKPIDAATQKLMSEYAEARKRGDAMQKEIEDCLSECDYNAEARKVIFDQALLGTGVIKGPVVVNRVRRAWNCVTDTSGRQIWSLEIQAELKPASFRIDPRCFFPDPLCGEHVQNGRGAYEYDKITSKQVRDLLKQPGYIKSQIARVLNEGPQVGKAQVHLGELEDRDLVPGQVYEHWIYWGEIQSDVLEAAKIDIPGDPAETEQPAEDTGGDETKLPKVISACVEMINSTIVRAYLNPLPDDALPYDMAPLERVPGSVWGYGVPMLMRAQQRVINAAWRMILDNAGVSSGPQIVVKANAIQPADKQWTLTSRKIWYASDDVEDVNKAFGVFEFPSRQAELENIINMADKLSDQETAVPMIAQAQQGSAPETVGGMQLLMNSANTMLKRIVKVFDDLITKPHMRRYYNYLMEYSDKSEIKGDFDVVALGSSALVIRDIQNQSLTNMLALASNPTFAPLINAKKLYERVLKTQHLDPVDIMNTDDEIRQALEAAQANQQPDPRVQAAQARAKADEDRTQAQVEMNREVLSSKRDVAMADLQFRRENLQIEREIEMLKLSQKENISLEQIRASLAAVSIQTRAKQDMHALDKHFETAAGGDPTNPSGE